MSIDSNDNPRESSPPPSDLNLSTIIENSVAAPKDATAVSDSVSKVLGNVESTFMKPSSWTPDEKLKAEAHEMPKFAQTYRQMTRTA